MNLTSPPHPSPQPPRIYQGMLQICTTPHQEVKISTEGKKMAHSAVSDSVMSCWIPVLLCWISVSSSEFKTIKGYLSLIPDNFITFRMHHRYRLGLIASDTICLMHLSICLLDQIRGTTMELQPFPWKKTKKKKALDWVCWWPTAIFNQPNRSSSQGSDGPLHLLSPKKKANLMHE